MSNEDQKPQVAASSSTPRSGRTNGFIPTSFRAFSRIVSSGAFTVASTVRSAASAFAERETDAYHDQVIWAGFDKLECEGGSTHRILLLGYRFGFQIWDVEEAHDVHQLTSRYDGHVSFLQMLPKPLASERPDDRFANHRPLLVVCADGSFSGGGGYVQDGFAIPSNGNPHNYNETLNSGFVPTAVWFYSLKSHSYKHILKFRSAVCSVRCSSRIVAILQAAQIQCFDAATLEIDYTILTNPIVTCPGSVTIGVGPLAVGPRWIAYSGSPLPISDSGRVSPQHLTHSASFPGPTSSGSLVAHYAKESSKQLAAGIVTLGDIGYKKLSRYYSEILPEGNNTLPLKDRAVGHAAHLPDSDNLGMVVIRDVVKKYVIAQFRAHKSPISSLCFDPSGTLLVTASIQGHNIHVYRIMPSSACSDSGPSYVQLYTLQRGLTNAVIQDISFSNDSHWIMISSTRTSHLFAISPLGGSVNLQCAAADTCFTTRNGFQNASSYPIALSAVSRIRSGNSGWRSTVTGAAAAAAGKVNSFSGAIASTFHNCQCKDLYADSSSSSMGKYNLLVFSHPGSVIQYALRTTFVPSDSGMSGLSNVCESTEARLIVEAIQKWNILQKQQNRRDQREENMDIYGENGNQDSGKVFPEDEGGKKEKSIIVYPESAGVMVDEEGGKKEKSTMYLEFAGAVVTKVKMSADEKHHIFISEAELQIHEPRFPLWAKSEMYFQSMIKDDIEFNEGGEIEIERIPVRMIEPRSKNLVPLLPYLQAPTFQQPRVTRLDSNDFVETLHSRSTSSENGRLSRRSSNGSLDSMMDHGVSGAETCDGNENSKGKCYVNKSDSLKLSTRLENVNNSDRESSTQSKFVNNNVGLKMES